MTATTSAFTRTGPGWRYRLESLPIERLWGLAIATGLVVVSAVVHAVNLTSAPQRLAAEGDVVTRAWAAGELDALGATPYLYDHPPLGWLQMSAWTWLTGAFGRAPTAVAAGREAALVAGLVAAALLWVLARRLGLARWSAAVALALFALTPLAVEHQRLALLENLAVPWILAAFVLAASPRQRLGALAASGACLGIAVLTSETALLLVPALALALWRATLPATRRVVLTLAGSALLGVCGTFALIAAVRGQLLPGDGPNLIEGAWHQVFGRPSTGSVFDRGSATSEIVAGWLWRDPISPLVALVAAVVALRALPRLAPIAVGFLVVAAVVLRPGHVPAELVIVLLPLGALLVGGAAEHAWNWPAPAPGSAAFPPPTSAVGTAPGPAPARAPAGPDAGDPHRRERPFGAWLLAGAALAAAVSSPTWLGHHRRLLAGDADRPLRDATAWIVDNVPADQRLIVDDAMWVDLVEAGADPDLVTGYAALDGERDLGAAEVAPWDEHDLVVTTRTLRAFPGGHPQVEAAARGSVVVAAFGSGRDRVDVRRIIGEGRRPAAVTPGRAPAAASPRAHDREAAAAAGAALARNPSLELSAAARTALVEGDVDERVTTVLVAITAGRTVLVDAFPTPGDGDGDADAPRRAFEMQAATPADAEAIAQLVADQQAPYTPTDVDLDGGRRLSVTYPP